MQNEIQSEADAQAARLVTERLNEISRRTHRANSRFWKRFWLWNTGVIAGVVLVIAIFGINSRLCAYLLLPLVIAPVIALIATDSVRAREMPRFDAEELARLGGARAIGPLFAALQYPLPEKQAQAIYHALYTLFPQLKASDAVLLTPAARDAIYWHLEAVANETGAFKCPANLCIVALKALEQVGDSSAIPVVKRVAGMSARSAARVKIKQAAIDCLPMLRANCRDVEAARTLLRASQPGEARPDTLLRPATGAGQTDKNELLRGAGEPSTPALLPDSRASAEGEGR